MMGALPASMNRRYTLTTTYTPYVRGRTSFDMHAAADGSYQFRTDKSILPRTVHELVECKIIIPDGCQPKWCQH